ncbi:MAG: hypothetical protein HY905_10635 [Deltaproteobacteria bacterium]|nr:hypothetical protein [Deltaproteobacteria bacterium]
MSTITMIGIEGAGADADEVDTALSALHYRRLATIPVTEAFRDESAEYASGVSEQMSWWVAANGDLIDLDRVYDLARALHAASFDRFLGVLGLRNDIWRVGFLFFDLGDAALATRELPSVGRLLCWIRDTLAGGAPLGSLYAWARCSAG